MTGLEWQKSSYSGEGANCLYVAAVPDGTVRLRESDAPDVVLSAAPDELRELIRGVQAGDFDHTA